MPKIALGVLLLLALVAPLALAAPAEAAPKPVKLKLVSLVCRETNDILSADEILLKLDGTTVFGPTDIRNNETIDLGAIAPKKFRRTITATLIDKDTDGVNADDLLGTVTIRRSQVGQGVLEATFQERGADYSLFFKVIN